MSRLSSFNDQPEVITIDDMMFKVYPLKTKHMTLLEQLSDKGKREQATVQVIKNSLRDEPDITDQEIQDLSIPIQAQFIDAVIKVNGFEETVAKARERAEEKLLAGQG